MKIHFRPLVPNDIYTVKQFMAFSGNEYTRGIVAYDKATAKTAALFIAQDWTHTSAQVHQIIIKPMVIRHGWFEEIADWMFNEAGRIKLIGLVPSHKPKAKSLNEKLGFKELCRIEDGYDRGIDYIVMELNREDCPYWTPREEREVA